MTTLIFSILLYFFFQYFILNKKKGIKKTQEENEIEKGVSEETKTIIFSQHKKMNNDNKLYNEDLTKLRAWDGLDYREEGETKIIYIPGFGEICSTMNARAEYEDMKNNDTVNIDNLKNSYKFKKFSSTVQGCEIVGLYDTYRLINLVSKQIGISDLVDEDYINTVFKQYKNENLPLEHPLGRALRALSILICGCFVVPILGSNIITNSIECNYGHAGIYSGDYEMWVIQPIARIINSL